MTTTITKRKVDALRAEPGRREKLYDARLTGFGVVAYDSGKKSFFVEYGPKEHRRRLTLGQYGPLTVEQARELAQVAIASIAEGHDPLSERAQRRAMPTFESFVEEYLEVVRRRKKQPRHDERYLAEAQERWGARAIDAISRRDVQAAMGELGEVGHTTANRWLASVRACFSEAVRQNLIEANPAMGVQPYREGPPRDRVLSDEELKKAVEAMESLEPYERAAMLLLMHTGARKSEVLRAKWEDVDLDRAVWRLPSPKSGRPQAIPLVPDAVELLCALPRLGPYLIPGRDPMHPRSDLKRTWEEVRSAAGLSDVTIHDLRRTFGLLAARTAGIFLASKLLRHSSVRVTEAVYAPLGVEDIREAALRVSEQRGKVIPLKRAKGG
jgi:integrase